jgi:YspA, cpYpsA-related SLOG family
VSRLQRRQLPASGIDGGDDVRILISGSRYWQDAQVISDALVAAIADVDGPVTIVHGGARGADQLAAALATTFGPNVTTEKWPADWDRHGKKAGVIRNQEMVDAGADWCLAFPLGESRGTRDCIRRAEKAGIPTIVHDGEPNA